jgi:hypothetical protein
MSFVLNPPEGGTLPTPDHITRLEYLTIIGEVLEQIFQSLDGKPYFAIKLAFRHNNTEIQYAEHFIRHIFDSFPTLQLYEMDGNILFHAPGNKNDFDFRNIFIMKRKVYETINTH